MEQEVALKINDHDHEIKSLKHRVGECEEQQKIMNALVNSVNELALNMKHMFDEQKAQGARLTTLEQVPANDYRHYRLVIGGCLITGIVGAVLGAIIALVIK